MLHHTVHFINSAKLVIQNQFISSKKEIEYIQNVETVGVLIVLCPS